MKLTIEIDLTTIPSDSAAEAGRILRYWAGALAQMDLASPTEHALMNSTYDTRVGTLRLTSEDA